MLDPSIGSSYVGDPVANVGRDQRCSDLQLWTWGICILGVSGYSRKRRSRLRAAVQLWARELIRRGAASTPGMSWRVQYTA